MGHIGIIACSAEGAALCYRTVCLTKWLVSSEVYPEKLEQRGIAYMRPAPAEREEISQIIMDELVRGMFQPEGIAYHQRVIERLKGEGCDAVVLGCTEIPLIINDSNSALPVLDSTRLLARAAITRALARAGSGTSQAR